MYNPTQEEYMIFNPGNVLPEFVVQCRWDVDTSEGLKAPTDNAGAAASLHSDPLLGHLRLYDIEPQLPQLKPGDGQSNLPKTEQQRTFGALQEIQNTFDNFLESQSSRWAGSRASAGPPGSIVRVEQLRRRVSQLQIELKSCRRKQQATQRSRRAYRQGT